jgi:hypothetical protein
MMVLKEILNDILLAMVRKHWHLWVLEINLNVAESFPLSIFPITLRDFEKLIDLDLSRV